MPTNENFLRYFMIFFLPSFCLMTCLPKHLSFNRKSKRNECRGSCRGEDPSSLNLCRHLDSARVDLQFHDHRHSTV